MHMRATNIIQHCVTITSTTAITRPHTPTHTASHAITTARTHNNPARLNRVAGDALLRAATRLLCPDSARHHWEGGGSLAPAVASAWPRAVACDSESCRARTQVSLTPLGRADGRPHQQLCSSIDGLAHVLASWPAATAAVQGGSAASSGDPGEVLRLSDAAFLARAERSTAAAEAALSAVEQGGGSAGGPLRAADGLLDALRANLQVRTRVELLPRSKRAGVFAGAR